MQLLSINVSLPVEIIADDGRVLTNIFKKSVAGPVKVGALNLAGDAQAAG